MHQHLNAFVIESTANVWSYEVCTSLSLWKRFSVKKALHETEEMKILASPGSVFVVHIGSAFGELPTPSSDHTVAHNVRSMHVAQLEVDLCWRLLLSVQKSDNCTNLSVGGRQYRCSHFLLAQLNNYCCHKTNCCCCLGYLETSLVSWTLWRLLCEL